MKYWFTADTHFGHENIIKFTDRPFKSLSEMDDALIRNWNSRVKPNDTIFVVGDFCFKNSLSFDSYAKSLNGNKIFIKGNHDPNNGNKAIIENIVINHGGHQFLLIHDPIYANWNGLVLCGHVHNNWDIEIYDMPDVNIRFDAINVGVDVWGFKPVSINEILKRYSTKFPER